VESIKRLKQHGVISLLIETFQEWQRDKSTQIAGSMAYFIILSLAPLLVIAVATVSVVTDRDTVQGEVYDRIADVIGDDSAQVVQDMVSNANQAAGGGLATLVSFLTLIYAASGAFGQVQDALNRVWSVDIKEKEGFLRTIKRRGMAAAMLPLTGLVILLAIILDTVLSAVGKYFSEELPSAGSLYLFHGLGLVVTVLLLTLLFAVIYRYLPDADIEWEDVLMGAAFTAILFSVGQLALSIYLGRGTVSSSYGAAGTFMVILIWLYYSALIFLFGAEFTQVYARRQGKQIRPAKYAYSYDKRASEPTPPPEPAEIEGIPAK